MVDVVVVVDEMAQKQEMNKIDGKANQRERETLKLQQREEV